ncbi:hypothetical protein [Novosphingobium sp. AP12]|uniref:hypothetical protein n=1 Tax=Novosphingobium sp. AP12 TaxID=1144305 RepID=UPI0002722425|nr:hypothetical protein [Novosphingobium sp. AP12]EJL24797.1 hypothetical protein PMI02_03472 [Novosphingobium sp. AP12]
MTRTLPLLVATAALALGACSKGPDATATQALPTETEEVFQEDAGSASEVPEASPTTAASLDEIPEVVRGRWGLVAADCTSTKGDAKGLLEVSADQLKFYESVAKLGTIKEAGESRIRATFAYTGEGQSWSQDVVLDVQDDGKTLIRRDYGPDAMPGPLKYTRCT